MHFISTCYVVCACSLELQHAWADWAHCGEPGSPRKAETHLCIREDRRWDDLVRAKRLSRVDKGRQDLARFPALACIADLSATSQPSRPHCI